MDRIPFALQASRAEPSHAGLALALAAEFRPPLEDADAALDDLARPMLASRFDEPAAQLMTCGEALAGRLTPGDLSWSGIDDLLLDRVLAGGFGHPLALAVACVEAGRRAGLALGIVAGATGCFVGHRALTEPLLLDVAGGGSVIDAGGRTEEVGWQCSHQTAARILGRIGERAERTGNLAWALRAAELRLALPFSRPVLEDLRHALAHLRARLN